MHRYKADLLFFTASLAGVGGIVASLRGTDTMLYVAFSLLGIGGTLVAAGIVTDRARGHISDDAHQTSPDQGTAVANRDATKAGHARP